MAHTEFKLAKALFSSPCGGYQLPPEVQEELVISACREYYDNAESGNQNVGEMKLALDWYVSLILSQCLSELSA